jgi:hypothetical protein
LEHAVEEVDSHQALHGQEVKLLVGSGPDVDVVSSLVPQTPQGFSQTVWHLRRVLVEEENIHTRSIGSEDNQMVEWRYTWSI